MATKNERSKKSTKKVPLESLTYRGAKRLAVAVGMPFPDACGATFSELMVYLNKNSHLKSDPELINKYDDWMDEQLAARGYGPEDPHRHYQLRLSYISEENTKKIPKLSKKPKKEKEIKPKKEKDERGLWKGTKKSYTFELTMRGYDLERVTRRVLKKFPDANESSIKQWWKKALKTKI